MTTANMTAANVRTIATAIGTVTCDAAGIVRRNDEVLGRVFPNPENAEQVGYETGEHVLNYTADVESPLWFMADDDGDAVSYAVRRLVSRGDRGTVGRGNPSARWVASFAVISREGGATRAEILAAMEKASGRPVRAHLLANHISALRKRHGVTIEFNRTADTYRVVA